jgi:hypothetical protein
MPMIFFHFLKIIFDISTSKRSKKYKSHSILVKKKNFKFDETQLQTQCQTQLIDKIYRLGTQSRMDEYINWMIRCVLEPAYISTDSEFILY